MTKFVVDSKDLKEHYDNTPTVVCVIISDAKFVLAIQRANNPGKNLWGLPGGYQMAGETWQQAGLREVHEETGMLLSTNNLSFLSLETDEYGNNLVIAQCYTDLSNFTYSLQKWEVLDLRRVTKSSYKNLKWAFPRHQRAVANFFGD